MLVPCGLGQWLKIVAEDGKNGVGHIYFLYYFHYFYQILANVEYLFTVYDWSITFTEKKSFIYILINNIYILKNKNSVMTCCGNAKFTLKFKKKIYIYICDVQVKTCAKWTMERCLQMCHCYFDCIYFGHQNASWHPICLISRESPRYLYQIIHIITAKSSVHVQTI